jgi:hypothetical protein
MKPHRTDAPLAIQPPPDAPDPALAPLLDGPFAHAWQATPAMSVAAEADHARRNRLMARVRAGRAAEASMVTVRHRAQAQQPLAAGATAQMLYRAEAGRPVRPGEPLRARLITLQPEARLGATPLGDPTEPAHHREWLVMEGTLSLGGITLGPRDYHVQPAGQPWPELVAGPQGARLFLRESDTAAQPSDAASTVRDADAGWPDFAPGIQRRVLWQRDGQAALLYLAQPGAQVPQHSHGHDEECLMVQGELFLDDLLLQQGDYQLAPA